MIEDPLIYLIIEKIKQLNNSRMNFEEIDCELNLLDYVLFRKNQEHIDNCERNNYTYILTNSYLHLNQEDYQSIGIEANVWFLELIHDYMVGKNNLLINSENISRLAHLYVILEHPYCRYLIIMICSSLSDIHDFRLDNFKDKIWSSYKNQKLDMHFESDDEHISEENERLERMILMEEIEIILEDIDSKRRSENY